MVNIYSKIYIAGHKGLVGSAILKRLRQKGYKNLEQIYIVSKDVKTKRKKQKIKLDELRKLLEKEEEKLKLFNEEVKKQEIIKINNLKPTSAIFTQNEASEYPNGETYDYNDTKYENLIDFENQKTIIYEGSKSGRGDNFIKSGALFFAREKKRHDFTYIGQVTFVREISKNKKPEPAKYELTLTRNILDKKESDRFLRTVQNLKKLKSGQLDRLNVEVKKSKIKRNHKKGIF